MKLWGILFLLLPLLASAYVGWRLWHLVPASAAVRALLLCVLFGGLLTIVFYLRVGLDHLPRPMAIALYEYGTSFPMVLLYLFMLFVVLDLLRLVGVLPQAWMLASWRGTALVTGIMAVVFGYGYLNYLHKVRVPITIKTEKPLPKELKIVMMSDLHLGYHNRRAELSRWVDLVNREQADLVLIAGDIVDFSIKPIMDEQMAEEFGRFDAPVYACLGNHEFYGGLSNALAFYRQAGITLLKDSVAEAKGIRIIGRDDRTNLRRKSLEELSESSERGAFTILLDHQPYHLEEAEHAGIDFQLSGHSHYGQVWPISWIEDLIYEKAFGAHRRGKTQYYITSGMGIWGGKFRIGTRSEYVVLTLQPAE